VPESSGQDIWPSGLFSEEDKLKIDYDKPVKEVFLDNAIMLALNWRESLPEALEGLMIAFGSSLQRKVSYG
jgi:hypothetical protein